MVQIGSDGIGASYIYKFDIRYGLHKKGDFLMEKYSNISIDDLKRLAFEEKVADEKMKEDIEDTEKYEEEVKRLTKSLEELQKVKEKAGL